MSGGKPGQPLHEPLHDRIVGGGEGLDQEAAGSGDAVVGSTKTPSPTADGICSDSVRYWARSSPISLVARGTIPGMAP